MSAYRVQVFGKPGCEKCKMLNQRLDKLLKAEEWKDFEKAYYSLDTEEGLIEFCDVECLNPQRIPALVVQRRDGESGGWKPLPNAKPGEPDPLLKKSLLHQHLGLQTDYSATGKGLITPDMLKRVLELSRSAA